MKSKIKQLLTSMNGDLGGLKTKDILDIKIKTRVFNNKIQTEKVWVTLLNNGFEKVWIPLLDKEGNHIDWVDEILFTDGSKLFGGRLALAQARHLFRGGIGVSPCSQKELNNSCKDNF